MVGLYVLVFVGYMGSVVLGCVDMVGRVLVYLLFVITSVVRRNVLGFLFVRVGVWWVPVGG
jgi:hypothetical protein